MVSWLEKVHNCWYFSDDQGSRYFERISLDRCLDFDSPGIRPKHFERPIPYTAGYSGYLKVWSGFGVSGTTCVRSTRKFLKCNCSWLTLILNVTSENVLYDSFQFINFFSSSFLPEFTYFWKVSWSLITKVKLVRLPFQVEKFIFSIAWTIYLIFFLILYHGFNLLFYSRDWILN